MSKTDASLQELRIDTTGHKGRRQSEGPPGFLPEKRGVPKMSSRSSDFVYVNPAYAGSLNSVTVTSENRLYQPPTTVVREQYWACSRWPQAQRILAITVGVLLGALIGLAVTMAVIFKGDENILDGIFRRHPTPD